MDCYKLYYINSMSYVLFNLITSNKLNDEETIEIINFLSWLFKVLDELNIDLSKVKEKNIADLIVCIKENDSEKALNRLKTVRIELEKYTNNEIREVKLNFKSELI